MNDRDKSIIQKTTGAMDAQIVKGMPETGCLYDAASKVPKHEIIVEYGSWLGKSTLALALGSLSGNGAKVYAVDPHENTQGCNLGHPWNEYKTSDWQAWFAHMEQAPEVWSILRPVGLYSYDFALSLPRLPKIGLLWIDSSHTYEGTKREVETALPFLSPEAPIIFDDRNEKGVAAVIQEMAEQGWVFDAIGWKVAYGCRDRGFDGGAA